MPFAPERWLNDTPLKTGLAGGGSLAQPARRRRADPPSSSRLPQAAWRAGARLRALKVSSPLALTDPPVSLPLPGKSLRVLQLLEREVHLFLQQHNSRHIFAGEDAADDPLHIQVPNG